MFSTVLLILFVTSATLSHSQDDLSPTLTVITDTSPAPIVSLAPTDTPAPTPTPTPIFPTPTIHPGRDLYSQYKTDYLFLRDNYQRDYLTYIDKSRIYTKYGTVISQKEKLDAAQTALISRNKMFGAYLQTIRTQLDIYQHSAPTDTEALKIDLARYESWFNEQTQILLSINNVTDMDTWAKEFRPKYISIQTLVYNSLIRIEINSMLEALSQIKILADTIRPHTTNQGWVSTLEVKTDLVRQSLNNALETGKVKQNQNRFSDFYPDAQKQLTKARDYLSDINNDLKIVVIKYYQP